MCDLVRTTWSISTPLGTDSRGMGRSPIVDPAAPPHAPAVDPVAGDRDDDLALALGLADTADALRAVLGMERPGDAVLGEERGGEVSENGRGWVLDPIDGTKNFSRGVPAWATLIALTVHGRSVVGVASAPALGRRWWGATGLGAWASEAGGPPRRISVSSVTDLADAYLSTTDFRTFSAHGELQRWLSLAYACWEARAFGDFWQHVLVAEGVLDLAVDRHASAWDLAAAAPIVAEAGGRLTDLAGVDTHDGGSALTSNGRGHAAALALLSG